MKRATREQRIAWLLHNPACWMDYDFGPRSDTKRILFEMMQTSGLYSWTTNWFDAGLTSLIEEAGQKLANAA